MKKFATVALLFLIAIVSAFAHEADMSNTQGLFGLSPEYIHTLINPLPTYGTSIGIGVLFIGLLARNITTRNIGLVIILLSSGIAWAVLYYGQHAYNHLFPELDAESKKWADLHMDRAESFIWAFYVTGALSLIALAAPKCRATPTPIPTRPQPQSMDAAKPIPAPAPTTPKIPTRTLSPIGTIFAVIVLISAIISFALGSWISKAGGRIRHTEFRDQPAPVHAEPHEHHHD